MEKIRDVFENSQYYRKTGSGRRANQEKKVDNKVKNKGKAKGKGKESDEIKRNEKGTVTEKGKGKPVKRHVLRRRCECAENEAQES